jgi:transcriptional regulator with XRE-family HTH domain
VAETRPPIEIRKLGDNIRRLRTSQGMSQERLSELAAINPRTIRRVEAGEINASVSIIAQIRAALRCPWDDLMPPNWKP